MSSYGVIAGRAATAAILLAVLYCAAAAAEERKIYKHVDEKGIVTYSEVPPTSGTNVQKLDIKPAYRGQGGNISPGYPYGDPRLSSPDYGRDQYHKALQQRQQQIEAARNKRIEELEAECNRNRGTDCGNPDALRYIESTKIPRRY